ncbi:MAG: hypothetical protein IIA61_05545 [Candidatus Marinimicrobia bacterium]|nr:hypothetical protein [Candidatus Neomarinimicrobiota bacterium]
MKRYLYPILFYLPTLLLSQPEGFGIPARPDQLLPAGYEWQLQQTDDGNVLWVARQTSAGPVTEHIAKPTDIPPEGMEWYPITSHGIITQWVVRETPSWFKRNRDAVEFFGGFILAVLNIFSFVMGRKMGAT